VEQVTQAAQAIPALLVMRATPVTTARRELAVMPVLRAILAQ
jgi:hypothetical protein